MKKRNGLILAIYGAAATLLSAVFIIIGVLDAIETSQYRDIGMNTPVVILAALVFIGGVIALVMGLKKSKAEK
jgi:uncharacterized membrane protein